jgi:hypothetical protein
MIRIRNFGMIKTVVTLVLLLRLIMPIMCQYLSGKWQANRGGGFYYMRQMGDQLFWLGELRDSNPDWCNVAQGKIVNFTIDLFWADVPKGKTVGGGELILKISSPIDWI